MTPLSGSASGIYNMDRKKGEIIPDSSNTVLIWGNFQYFVVYTKPRTEHPVTLSILYDCEYCSHRTQCVQ